MTTSAAESTRLETLWSGEFGDAYVDRNASAYDYRRPFWESIVERTDARSVLEVGCNLGGNLRWLAELVEPQRVYGVDINVKALSRLRAEQPEVNGVWSPARDLPFRDRHFDLVFTMGVLIHQPEATLPLVMNEMVRCSRRYVLCGEYHSTQTEEVHYRGHEGALFRRDYGGIFQDLFPEMTVAATGFLPRDTGWDDITWWLLERR